MELIKEYGGADFLDLRALNVFAQFCFEKGREQGRADAIDEALYEYAFWLFTNYSGGGAVGGSVAHDNAVKSIEEFKQMQKGAE